jgi:hypothetical protein
VEKSRDIYENLVAEEDLEETIGGNEVEDLVDEVSLDEEGISEEEEEGADEAPAFDSEELPSEEGHEEAEIEDRVVDLESALDELKAEFDALMAGEEHEEEAMPGIHGDEGHEEVGAEIGGEEEQTEFYEAEEKDEDDEEDDKEEVDETIVREYVEKVGDTGQGSESGKMSASGAKTPQTGGKNTKSIVASKNDMGGTAVLSKGGNQDQNGTRPAASEKPKGTLVSNPQNKPGANAGKTAFKTKEAATGSEGKLAGNDGSVAVNKTSPLKAR